MKINKQDDNGLRILLSIAKSDNESGLSIPQISEATCLSQPYVAKISRTLRLGGLIESNPGKSGGYCLSKPQEQIIIKDVIDVLGGKFYQEEVVSDSPESLGLCTNSIDCAVNSLWKMIQFSIDRVLENTTLADLSCEEDVQNNTALMAIIRKALGSVEPELVAETK